MTKWTPNQTNTVYAAVTSWGMDAFDFFLLVFVINDIANSFHVTVEKVSLAVFLTLAVRPIGAIIFGRVAEKIGRKPVLIANIIIFSLLEAASALAPNLFIFLIIRCLYGVAMGGIWGVASSLALETAPKEAKGFVSGLFQAGYPLGYLTAAVFYGLFFSLLGWQNLFIVGSFPILLAAFIYYKVEESPVWLASKAQHKTSIAIIPVVLKHWKLCIYAILLMTCFNFFSHGTQDAYPTFLSKQRGFEPHIVSIIAIFYNIASILGGVFYGTLSGKIGCRKAIIIAALLSLPAIPLWAFSTSSVMLGIGAFIMQFMVQGAWGVIPVYLNELMPANTRAILPGLFYQLGNLFASINLTLQVYIANQHHGNYSIALALIATSAAICISLFMFFSSEKINGK